MNIALEVSSGLAAARDFAGLFTHEVTRRGAKVIDDPDVAPDLVVAVGGDGTMLAAVRLSIIWDVPVLGFNLGTFGFLTQAEADDLEEVAEVLLSGEFDIDERMTVQANVEDANVTGVNDVVVEKVDSMRLVELEVVVDGLPFTTYRADGLVVATPTGSTAYSFSAGGPLVAPGVGALVMTPVASHALFDRSLVLPGTSTIDVTVRRDRHVKVNVDKSQLGELGEGGTVSIRRGERPARFISFDTLPFPSAVRQKFGLD